MSEFKSGDIITWHGSMQQFNERILFLCGKKNSIFLIRSDYKPYTRSDFFGVRQPIVSSRQFCLSKFNEEPIFKLLKAMYQ